MTHTLTDNAMSPSLVVLSGFHAGARCKLPDGACSIGSNTDDTIVLSDPGIKTGHLLLEIHDDSITLQAARDGVVVDGVELAPGAPIVCVLPFTLTFAGVDLRCEVPLHCTMGAIGNGSTSHSANRPKALMLASLRPAAWHRWHVSALVTGCAALGMFVPGMRSIASNTHSSVPSIMATPGLEIPDAAAFVVGNTARPARQTPARAGLAVAMEDLQAKLAASGLTDIRLNISGGTIMARGSVDPKEMDAWRAVQQWFDDRRNQYDHDVTLVDEIRFVVMPPAAVVKIDAVWTGANPNVVIRGQRFFEGAILPNGLQIESILPGELIVLRQGQRQSLRF